MDAEGTFGLWVSKRRKALGLTREELSGKAGCSPSTLRKIESDERRPSRQLAGLLADALNIPPNDRSTFIRIARGEFSIDRLKSPLPHPDFNLLQPPQIFSPSIPIPLTPLIGREAEVSNLCQLLAEPQCRLITLVGPGGIGKTRLVTEVAARQVSVFKEGVNFIPLAHVGNSRNILPQIAETLQIKLQSSQNSKEQILNSLRPRMMLLVLDNFEHLLDGAQYLSEILQASPAVKLVVTSREQLNLHGEWVFEVSGLPIPKDDRSMDAESNHAVTLFLQRARQTKTSFELQKEERPSAIRICQLVDGLPLAVELAASWVRVLSCDEIAMELERSMDLLTDSKRNTPERHRSMRAVLDHSWDLLSTQEQQALRKLSVFRGGFNREAAAKVSEASLTLLSALTAKSLVHRSMDGRYDLHELVRQYCGEKLAQAGETEACQRAHFDYYLTTAEQNETKLFSAEAFHAFRWLTTEHANLQAALEWAQQTESKQDVSRGMRLKALMHTEFHKTGMQDILSQLNLTEKMPSDGP